MTTIATNMLSYGRFCFCGQYNQSLSPQREELIVADLKVDSDLARPILLGCKHDSMLLPVKQKALENIGNDLGDNHGSEPLPVKRISHEERIFGKNFRLVRRVSRREIVPNGSGDQLQLLHADGYLFKPLQPHDGNGMAERRFYEEMQNLELGALVPKFFGCRKLEGQGDCEYLQLEDLTADCETPALMDLKMGTKKFYAVAAEKGAGVSYPIDKCARQAQQDSKRTTGSLGFLVSGIRVPAVASSAEVAYDSAFGKAATDEEALEAVRQFVKSAGQAAWVVAAEFSRQCRALLHWYEHDHSYIIYNHSLLFVYDAAAPSQPHAKMRIIDFCHAWQASPDEIDQSGTEHGLRSLLAVFEEFEAR